jgi:hypothetical protein
MDVPETTVDPAIVSQEIHLKIKNMPGTDEF